MLLFLDSARVEEVREVAAWGVLGGVTTNPTLIAQSGRELAEVMRELASLVDGPLSAECLEEDTEAMVAEGRALAALHPNVVVKVPLTPAGLGCVRALAREQVRTNVTLCFSAAQGLLAARAGATFVSAFVGRLDDLSLDGMQVVRELAAIFRSHALPTQVLAASIRQPRHVVDAALAGAHAATVPYKIMRQLVGHPLTDAGVAQFLRDAGRTPRAEGSARRT